MSKDNVISMADFADDGMLSTPRQTLETAASLLDDPTATGCWPRTRRLLVLAFDDSGTEYEVHFVQCGFRYPELITALESLKLRLMREAGLL